MSAVSVLVRITAQIFSVVNKVLLQEKVEQVISFKQDYPVKDVQLSHVDALKLSQHVLWQRIIFKPGEWLQEPYLIVFEKFVELVD